MSSTFKTFQNGDITSTRTLLNEAIPVTGSIFSGSLYTRLNIKDFAHGHFSAVYDYPHLSSSANHVADITVGYSARSFASSSTSTQNAIKINTYNHMAQVLMGYDTTGSILEFDEDGDILAGGVKIREAIFVNFSRLLVKDEIKKGSVSLAIGAAWLNTSSFTSVLTITDSGAQNDFRVNSPAGEYGVLSASAGGAYSGSAGSGSCGLIFYQAGIMVLTASIFAGTFRATGKLGQDAQLSSSNSTVIQMPTGATVSQWGDALRSRIQDCSFNNTTELNSTHYFCRITNNEFNYSSNPTYVSGSKIVVKNNGLDAPVTYITEVGLYSPDNELLAVAKLSEPIKKDPTTELTLRCRADF